MALSDERLAEIRAKLARPNGWGCEKECGRDEVVDLLAEHDRLTAEVERLRPLAAIGQALVDAPEGIWLHKRRAAEADHRKWQIVGASEGAHDWLICGVTLTEVLTKAGLMGNEAPS